MTRPFLVIAAAILLPAAAQAETCNADAVTRTSAQPPAGNLELVSSYCDEGLCERVYERTVQPTKKGRAARQRYVVRIERDETYGRMALARR